MTTNTLKIKDGIFTRTFFG